MPSLYKILTFVIAFSGCISLVISGEVNPVMYVTGIGLLPGYYRFLRGMPQAPRWAIGGFSVLTLIIFLFDSFIVSNDFFLAVAHLTISFQAIKSFDLRDPWDHLQVYFMSLLQLIIASELTQSIAFGVIFIFFLITLVTAIVLAHFMREGTAEQVAIKRPFLSISALTLLMTIAFFLSAPRTSGGFFGKGHQTGIRTVGFADRVDFGSFGDVMEDPTVVMRIELSVPFRGTYYWRGMALDYFDGMSWKHKDETRSWVYKNEDIFLLRPFETEKAVVQKIYLEPMDTDVIFGLSKIAAVEARGRVLFSDSAGSLFLPAKKGRRFNYIVYSIDENRIVSEDADAYLQLPEGFRKVSELAQNLTADQRNSFDKAVVIERYLRENYLYSLSTSQPPEGISPVEFFLFTEKKGFCEHYATAMVIMLRSIGIPSRIVTGFASGEMNEFGGYIIVRQSNAHTWVEAAPEGVWKRFDPTPQIPYARQSQAALILDMIRMNWNRYVVAFSASDQREIVRIFSLPFRLPSLPSVRVKAFSILLYSMVSVIVFAGIAFLIRRIHFRRYGFATAGYLTLRNVYRKRGAKITPFLTPTEFRREAAKLNPDSTIDEFIRLYEEFRFGGREMGKEDRVRYRMLLKEIKSRLSQR